MSFDHELSHDTDLLGVQERFWVVYEHQDYEPLELMVCRPSMDHGKEDFVQIQAASCE